jgi:hypothetical protein
MKILIEPSSEPQPWTNPGDALSSIDRAGRHGTA